MIPLSLYVSLEIVKVFQIYFLDDLDMYDEVSQTPMEARTSTINEDLGQVRYVTKLRNHNFVSPVSPLLMTLIATSSQTRLVLLPKIQCNSEK